MLICEPYKSEIGPLWRFKTPDIAEKSAKAIYQLFLEYLKKNEFVGADLARKYLQMGYTRARRYANYKGGKKYDKEGNYTLLEVGIGEEEKVRSADIFYTYWKRAEAVPSYANGEKGWKEKFG